jgi:hypothetical protein
VPSIKPTPVVPTPATPSSTPKLIPVEPQALIPEVESTVIPVITMEPVKPVSTPVAEYGTIFGYVKNSSGKPMVGVQVELHSKPRITYTDAEGKYVFDNAALGKHTILLYNPSTREQSRIYVEVFKNHADEASVIKEDSILNPTQVTKDVKLDEEVKKQRVDFIFEPIKDEPKIVPTPASTPKPTPASQKSEPEPEKPAPSKGAPVYPYLPILLLAFIPLFRRNVIIYSIEMDSPDKMGLLIKKMRVKPKEDTIIDLTDLSADVFKVVFKRPSQFRGKAIIVRYWDIKEKVEIGDEDNFIIFNPNKE